MNRRCQTLLIAVVLPLLWGQGCYHYRVTTVDRPATEYEKKTIHNLFWGLLTQDAPATDCVGEEKSNGLDEVRISTNLGYMIVSVATAGIWVPLDVEWRCARLPVQEGEFGAADAPSAETRNGEDASRRTPF